MLAPSAEVVDEVVLLVVPAAPVVADVDGFAVVELPMPFEAPVGPVGERLGALGTGLLWAACTIWACETGGLYEGDISDSMLGPCEVRVDFCRSHGFGAVMLLVVLWVLILLGASVVMG